MRTATYLVRRNGGDNAEQEADTVASDPGTNYASPEEEPSTSSAKDARRKVHQQRRDQEGRGQNTGTEASPPAAA